MATSPQIFPDIGSRTATDYEAQVSSVVDLVPNSTHSGQTDAPSPILPLPTQLPAEPDHSMSQQAVSPLAEIVRMNHQTRSLEFYGASSSVAFLRRVHKLSGNNTCEPVVGTVNPPLDDVLQNTNTKSLTTPNIVSSIHDGCDERFYLRVGRNFLDAYFSTIHCIQPIFDREAFLTRCEDLWLANIERHSSSFSALCYATMSLGSLMMVWNEKRIHGEDRFDWSRKLFSQALTIITQLGSETNLEMIQCYYMLVGYGSPLAIWYQNTDL
jgi:hypothetical protein